MAKRKTKLEMAKVLVSSSVWGGIKDAYDLAKMYSYGEIKEWYDYLGYAEDEYFQSLEERH